MKSCGWPIEKSIQMIAKFLLEWIKLFSKTVSTYKPNIRTLPFVFIAVFVILLIYDAGLEQEELVPEVISESLSINIQNDQNIQSRDIHIVEKGENLLDAIYNVIW